MNPKVIVLFSADHSVQQAVAAAVAGCRHGLRLAATSEGAVNVLVHHRSDVDLFIIDLDEEMHGVSLLAALAFLGGSTPIVLLTSFEPSYCSRLAAATGVKAFLGKPISEELITKAIQRLVGGPSPMLVEPKFRNPRHHEVAAEPLRRGAGGNAKAKPFSVPRRSGSAASSPVKTNRW